MNLQEKVKYVRKQLLLTQSELAKRSGISLITITRWENQDNIKPQIVSYAKFLKFCEQNEIVFDDEKIDGGHNH